MAAIRITRAHARRFLVRRHLLKPPRSLPDAPESVLAVVETLGSLQFDPLEVTGARNHDMVLHARIRGYHRRGLDAWLYAQAQTRDGQACFGRRLFEAYNKSLNILPLGELAFHRVAWERAKLRHGRGILKTSAKTAKAILVRIDAEGPLTSNAFREHDKSIDWHWAPTREGRAVLEALFETGVLGISRRDGNKRHFDRVERLFPREALERRVTEAESLRHRMLTRFRGVGLMGSIAGSELTSGTAKAAARAVAVRELVAEGVLVPCEVEGLRDVRYMLASERATLDAAGSDDDDAGTGTATGAGTDVDKIDEVTFLAPLDPLMWDRRMVRALFDFDYTWEVYTPAEKRVHGYYVLPILYGARIVGRIEPRFERASGSLEILSVKLHDAEGTTPDAGSPFTAAFVRAVEAYRLFVGATRVRFPRTKHARVLARAFALTTAVLAAAAALTACKSPEPRHVRVPMQAGIETPGATSDITAHADDASASASTNATPGAALSLLGRWEGTGTQDDGTSWPMVVDITALKRGACAKARYPTIPCAGAWMCIGESDGRTMMAVEHITEGQKACVEGGTMRLVLLPDGAIDWSWAGPGDAAHARLHRAIR